MEKDARPHSPSSRRRVGEREQLEADPCQAESQSCFPPANGKWPSWPFAWPVEAGAGAAWCFQCWSCRCSTPPSRSSLLPGSLPLSYVLSRSLHPHAATRECRRAHPFPVCRKSWHMLQKPRVLLLCTPHAADAAAAVSWPTIVPMLAAGEAVHARLRLLLRCITLYSTHKRAVRRRGVSFHASASPTGNRFRCGRRLAGWVSPRHKRGTSLCPEQRIRGTALQNLGNYQSTGVRGADELSPPETAGCPVLSSRVHASSMESPSPGGDGSMTRPCSTAFAGWPVFQKPTTHHPRRRLQRRESLSCGS